MGFAALSLYAAGAKAVGIMTRLPGAQLAVIEERKIVDHLFAQSRPGRRGEPESPEEGGLCAAGGMAASPFGKKYMLEKRAAEMTRAEREWLSTACLTGWSHTANSDGLVY